MQKKVRELFTFFHDRHVEIHPIPSYISSDHYCSFRDIVLKGYSRKIQFSFRDSLCVNWVMTLQ